MGWPMLVDAQRDLIRDGDAVAFEGDYFFRVVGEDANVLEAEVDQDLRADAAFVLHHALAGGFAVELAARMKMDLREATSDGIRVDAETPARVMQVEKHAAVFLGDGCERELDQIMAVAGGAAEDVSR